MSYSASNIPRFSSLADAEQFLREELAKLAVELRVVEVDEVYHTVLTAAPAKTNVGMVVYADGTAWNPGAGEGLYVRTSGGWVKL